MVMYLDMLDAVANGKRRECREALDCGSAKTSVSVGDEAHGLRAVQERRGPEHLDERVKRKSPVVLIFLRDVRDEKGDDIAASTGWRGMCTHGPDT